MVEGRFGLRACGAMCWMAACVWGLGCQAELGVEDARFVCASEDDCLAGYGCIHTEATPDVTICADCRVEAHTASCEACMRAECCAESRACSEEVVCHNNRGCVAACGDDVTCRAQCDLAFEGKLYDALVDHRLCRGSKCASACGGQCGELALPLRGDVEGCRTCLNANCCDLMEACAEDRACLNFLECIRTAPAYDHTQACLQTLPSEDQLAFVEVIDCLRNACGSACEGQRWTCLDTYTEVAPERPEVTWTFRLFNGISRDGLERLTVKRCVAEDVLCATPAETKLSDANGEVTFVLPTVFSGFKGYLEITDERAEPVFVPERYIISPSPTADGLTRAVFLISANRLNLFLTLSELVGGPTIDSESRGAILIETHDCALRPAEGVAFSIDAVSEGSVVSYIHDDVPDFGATATDASGLALIANIPPGQVTLTATLIETGEVISQTRMFVRPGWLIQTRVVPTAVSVAP